MARLRRAEGTLKPHMDLEIDGESALLAATAISTPRHRILEGDEPLTLTDKQDPRHIVANWVHQRNQVILEDNQVDIFIAAHSTRCASISLSTNLITDGNVARGSTSCTVRG